MRGRYVLSIAVAATTAACFVLADDDAGELSPGESVAFTRQMLAMEDVQPLTTISVAGAGQVDIENDYLPKVVCCEHGFADAEALKAQAVMARTYMYFRYYGENRGTVAQPLSGTQADQVYFCSQPTTDACRAAVKATGGQIMAFTGPNGKLYANVAFFVDGPRPACLANGDCSCPRPSPTTSMTPQDHPADCSCFTFASMGLANPAYVTYNWSRSGAEVIGSTLGNPSHESNRGCASQNIQNCLSQAGFPYTDLLRMFYGQDIQLRLADGTLVDTDEGEGVGTTGSRRTDAGAVGYLPAQTRDFEAVEGCRMVPPIRSSGWASAFGLTGLATLGAVRRRRRAPRR